MASNWRASQNAHPPNRIVRFVGSNTNPGFLLSRTGSTEEPSFWAMFNDAKTEHINPPAGAPRPTPDPAVRTKFQAVPSSLRTGMPVSYILASMFSGQMRNVVQCEFSRGQNTKFSRTWARTHGLLEFPQPHRTGSDVAAEAKARALRRYFIIEISNGGIYAAPVTFGMTCASCARIDEYMLEGATALNLADFYAANPTGKVLRVLSAEQIAPAYAAGSPWYTTCGWAFSYSGMQAANVVARGDNSAGYDAYLTNLIRINFSVALQGQSSVQIVRFGSVARVFFDVPHGFANDDVIAVYGADQDEYNGAHVASNVTSLTLDFNLNGSPASPATGDLRIGGLDAPVSIGASIETAATGRVLFKAGGGGTLWVPAAPGVWSGIPPTRAIQSVSGPVHVFYDGEEEIVTSWQSSVANVAESETANPPISSGGTPNRWNGNASGTHALGYPRVTVPIVQSPECETAYDVFIGSGSGERITAHTQDVYGFTGQTPGTVTTFSNRFRGTAVSAPSGETTQSGSFTNKFVLCGGGEGTATILSEETHTDVMMTTTELTENAGGTSSLILFGEEREAIACLQVQTLTAEGSTRSVKSRYLSRRKETKIGGDGDFTNLDIPSHAILAITFDATPSVPVSSASGSAEFMVRWSGGGGYTKFVPLSGAGDVLSPRLLPFVRYTPGEKETAESDLLLMRGGLWYDEPQLVPKNQRTNAVYNLDGDLQTIGGFEQLNGRTPIGFVGQV